MKIVKTLLQATAETLQSIDIYIHVIGCSFDICITYISYLKKKKKKNCLKFMLVAIVSLIHACFEYRFIHLILYYYRYLNISTYFPLVRKF